MTRGGDTNQSNDISCHFLTRDMCVRACVCVYPKLLPALRSPCHRLTGDICSSSLDVCAICIHGGVRVCYTTCRTASPRKDSNVARVGINTAERATDNWLLSINLQPSLCGHLLSLKEKKHGDMVQRENTDHFVTSKWHSVIFSFC